MPVVGLSGGIGSGKSTVARLLAERGAVIVDVDAIAREVVEPGTPGYGSVVGRFGTGILGEDAGLDRAALAALVFADEGARADLNGIVHPLVAAETARRVAAAPAGAVVVIDVPLLAEAATRGYDTVVIVEAPEAIRLERLRARGMDAGDARRRMGAQATDAERRALADVVIDNSGTEAELAAQVERLWTEISCSSRFREGDGAGKAARGRPG
ncbi:MAG: dephospho-CoA kinase [Acidimicrobiia bacterium]